MTDKDFIASLPEERREPVSRLLSVVRENIPAGFAESVRKDVIHFEVPLSLYPEGYHVGKEVPLPYVSIASEKGHIALHHFGLYMDKDLLEWFQNSYAEQVSHKLDMGKSCIRFKKWRGRRDRSGWKCTRRAHRKR